MQTMRTSVLLALTLALAACRTSPPAAGHPDTSPAALYAGGDGSSLDQAVIIAGAKDLADVDAEYAWLHQHVPGARVTGQRLITRGTRAFDKLDVTLPQGVGKSFYFDISGGYGRF